MKHKLYKTGDRNAPSSILDRNNEVVLDMCKVCGKVECELLDKCLKIKKLYTKQQVKKLMQKLVEEAQTFDLIEEQKWDNGDGYVDSNGFYLTKDFDKWFKENVK